MRLLRGGMAAAIALGILAAASHPGFAQTGAAQTPAPSQAAGAQMKAPASQPSPPNPPSPAAQASQAPGVLPPPAPAQKIYTVPAGTRVLLELRSAVNTKSAKPGDGVYLSSIFPVLVGDRVMIPAGVYVQGVVDRVARAGRIKGHAQLDMHFTEMIFPNGVVVQIPGLVNSLPGASQQSVKNDGEGTIEQAADKGRHAGQVAEVAIPTGGSVGTLGGLGAGHPVAGGVIGLGGGLAAVGLVSLFTRGADVNIESGTQVEMVLQRPLLLEEESLGGATAPGSVAPGPVPALVPVANQPKPMEKPIRPRILCPPGGLGCE